MLVTDREFDGLLKYSNEREDEETSHYLLEKKINVFRSRHMKSPENGTTTNVD